MPTWSPRNEEFGKRLQAARLEQGWSALKLSKLSGVSRSQIAKIENALCHVRLDEACTLAKLVGMAVAPDEQDYRIGVRHGFAAGAQMLIDFADKMKGEECQ